MNSIAFPYQLFLIPVVCLGLADLGQAQESAKPNILFLFADDHSFDSVHALGNDEVQTPHLDQLARSGITMTRAYNMGGWNGAVCMASRAMLNTGQFLWHAQRLDLKQEQAAGRMWSQRMKAAGYETFFTGKWHVPVKPEAIFDHVGSVRGGMPGDTPEGYNRPLTDQPDPWSPSDRSKGGFWAGGKHWSEVVADEAIGFLDIAKQSDQPFFMYIAFNAPHDPRQAPQSFVDQYPVDKIKVPNNFQSEYPYAEAMGAGRRLRDERLAPFPRTEHAVRTHRQEYYAIISHMDQQIGRILESLEQSGMSDSTYVVFTADHGLSCGHHGLLGKQNMYEHSMRVPFFVRGPSIPAGRQIDTPIYLQDLMATCLDWADADAGDEIEFRSLRPLWAGQRDQQYDSIYGGYINRQRMVIDGDWKLILYPEAEVVRLFNLKDDPLEMDDLAGNPDQHSRINSLLDQLKKLQRATGDPLELSN